MSRKLSASSTRKISRSTKKVQSAFDPAVLQKAREIVTAYRITLESDPDGGYVGSVVELPYVFNEGKTADECVSNTRDAAAAVVATMLEKGERPPRSASPVRRTEQVNVRLSPGEKQYLEDAASHSGFRGLSDYIRVAALQDKAL
jgi:predicted RNase H-like HicB family nuclease